MKAAKRTTEALSLADSGIDTSLENLSQIFSELTEGVAAQLSAETDQQRALADAKVKTAVQEALVKRDQLIEYRGAIVEREQRIRKTVQVAEALARRYKAFVSNLDSSIYQYMTEAKIDRIEGTIHRFAIHKQPDELQISDMSLLPDKYIILEPWFHALKTCKKLLGEILASMPSGAWCSAGSPSIDLVALDTAIDLILSNPVPCKPNKDKIIADLQAGVEIPGAFILKDRTRLDVK